MKKIITLNEDEYALLLQLVQTPTITVQLTLAKVAGAMLEKIIAARETPEA